MQQLQLAILLILLLQFLVLLMVIVKHAVVQHTNACSHFADEYGNGHDRHQDDSEEAGDRPPAKSGEAWDGSIFDTVVSVAGVLV